MRVCSRIQQISSERSGQRRQSVIPAHRYLFGKKHDYERNRLLPEIHSGGLAYARNWEEALAAVCGVGQPEPA
jgi:hypothetical protein